MERPAGIRFNSSRPTFAPCRGVVQYLADNGQIVVKLRVDQGDRIEYAISFQRGDGTVTRATLDLGVRGPLVQPFVKAKLHLVPA